MRAPRHGKRLAFLRGAAWGLALCACASPGAHPGEGALPVFYPEPPETPRIQFLATYSTDRDLLGSGNSFRRFILGEEPGRPIRKPYGVALRDGRLYVCDLRLPGVWVFDLRQRTVTAFGTRAPGRLQKPANIAVADDGTRYVTDTKLRRVMVYDAEGAYRSALGEPRAWKPSGIALAGDRLYVTDLENGQVVVLDRASGEEIERLEKKGSGTGELFFPTNLALGPDGHLFVSDTGNFRVVELDSQGDVVRQIGSIGRSVGHFARPKGVARDRQGRLYVVDAAFENVQIFGPEGKLLLFFGVAGNVPGGLNLPAQIAIDYDHLDAFSDRVAPGYALEYLIFVTSQFGANKVNVYGFLRPQEETRR